MSHLPEIEHVRVEGRTVIEVKRDSSILQVGTGVYDSAGQLVVIHEG